MQRTTTTHFFLRIILALTLFFGFGLPVLAASYHPTQNPNGLGNGVSSNVNFVPWLNSANGAAKNINVAIILAEPSDVTHTSTAITAQPCKLIPQKTYVNGYGKEYYTDLAYCITDYYKEVSHNTLNFTFQIFDNGGQWYKTDKTEGYYGANDLEDVFVRDAVLLSSSDVVGVGFGE